MRSNLEQTLLTKIAMVPSLISQIKDWKNEGKRIVFTNGVFDLLHLGHITYLAKAAELGDKLIIGLNSDASVKRLKGESRPVNDQNNRAALLAFCRRSEREMGNLSCDSERFHVAFAVTAWHRI